MEELFNYFGDWTWWILAGVFLIIELALPTFFFMWFSIAAVCVGLLVLIYPLGWQGEAALFALLSLVLLGLSRFYFKPNAIKSDNPNLHERSHNMIGKSLTLHEAITDGRGWVKIGDSLWQVEGPDLPKKTKVKVTATQSNILIVEKLGS